MADHASPDRSNRILRFALYGPANAGKTCILAALAMPHAATAGLSAVWRGTASDVPRPEGPEESWPPGDPAVARYRGAEWLRESIRALDHHHRGVGHVYSHLHHGGGDQDLDLARYEAGHDIVLLFEAPVDERHRQVREDVLA